MQAVRTGHEVVQGRWLHVEASGSSPDPTARCGRTLRAVETSLPVADRPRRPEWMKVRAPSPEGRYFDVKKLIHGASLNTVCEEARCPNIAECWGKGTATFQILGDTCTRACRYCYVNSGKPEHAPDPLEPLRLAQAAARMQLKHVVVTSVDRDDVVPRGDADRVVEQELHLCRRRAEGAPRSRFRVDEPRVSGRGRCQS